MTTIYADETKQTFSSRQVPWMKVGEVFDQPHFTAAEAAHLAGLDFDVIEHPVYWKSPASGAFTRIPQRRALVHPHTGATLSIVSDSYKTIQYGDAFALMDSVSPAFVAGGSLRSGRQGFLVIDLGDLANLDRDDPHRMYAILRTSHDTSRGVEIVAMPLRGRCMNMMTLRVLGAGMSGKGRWSFPHLGNVGSRMDQAAQALERLRSYQTSFAGVVDRLSLTKVADEQATAIHKAILPDRPRRDDQIAEVLRLRRESGAVGFDGTGWGLVNAVSEYMQWHRPSTTNESRLVGALSGTIHTTINRVATRALAAA